MDMCVYIYSFPLSYQHQRTYDMYALQNKPCPRIIIIGVVSLSPVATFFSSLSIFDSIDALLPEDDTSRHSSVNALIQPTNVEVLL